MQPAPMAAILPLVHMLPWPAVMVAPVIPTVASLIFFIMEEALELQEVIQVVMRLYVKYHLLLVELYILIPDKAGNPHSA